MNEETRLKISLAQKGKPRPYVALRNREHPNSHPQSEETKSKISLALKGQPSPRKGKPHPEGCGHCKWLAERMALFPQPVTGLEKKLYALLEEAAYAYIKEKRFGRYVVDAYVPEAHIAFEADGATWHSYPQQIERDAKRDEYLLSEFNLPVIRLTEKELLRIGGN